MQNYDFRRSTITLNVLSDHSIEGWNLGTILRECEEGELVLASTGFAEEALSSKEMADALLAAGSDPGFFNLNDDGEPEEE